MTAATASRSHSLLAPSAADRWTRCPGSVQLCKDLPEDRTSEAAALGTAKHQVAYWCLCHSFKNKTADGLQGSIQCADNFSFEIDDEFVAHVNTYIAGVRAAIAKGDMPWYELTLDTSNVLHVLGQSGTADVVIERRSRADLYIGDAKFGYNAVSPIANKQLLIYAAAALKQLDEFGARFATVTLAIHQPRVGDLPSEWVTTVQDVRERVAEFAAAAQLAMRPDAVFHPSPEACQWCPARGFCAAKAAAILADFPLDAPLDPLTLKPPLASLTEDALATALDRCDDIEAWCRDIRAEALRRARGGLEIPGYKVIEGRRGNRAWTDESMALLALQTAGVDPYNQKLITPPEAERRLKKAGAAYNEVAAWLVEQSPGAPSLAKVTEPGNPLPKVEFGLETPT